MTDDLITALLNNPLSPEPWTAAADWLRANGQPDAARRLLRWADARPQLRAALRWDAPVDPGAEETAANALPDERCRRLFVTLLGWLDERSPRPDLRVPTWPAGWSAERVRLVQQLAVLGAADALAEGAAEEAADHAYGEGKGESECAADEPGESLNRWAMAERGNAVAAKAWTMHYSACRMIEGGDGAAVAGLMAAAAVDGAGPAAAAAVWSQAVTEAAAAGRADTYEKSVGRSAAYRWAMANDLEERVQQATAEAEAAARSASHSLATWPGWRQLAADLG